MAALQGGMQNTVFLKQYALIKHSTKVNYVNVVPYVTESAKQVLSAHSILWILGYITKPVYMLQAQNFDIWETSKVL